MTRGVARLEQRAPEAAADEFRSALRSDPQMALARVGLALALLQLPDLEGAQREAEAAARALPDSPHAHHVLGLVLRSAGRTQQAAAAFGRVIELDPSEVAARVFLGQLLLGTGDAEVATRWLREALDHEPWNASAAYALGQALLRAGHRDEARTALARFQQLREAPQAITYSQDYDAQGRYAQAPLPTGLEPVPGEAAVSVRFVAHPIGRMPAGSTDPGRPPGIALPDVDGDGRRDVFVVGSGGTRLWLAHGEAFTDATQAAGLDSAARGDAAISADLDGDGREDLVVADGCAVATWLADGKGGFHSKAAMAPPRDDCPPGALAGLDVDHDGDVDLLAAGGGHLLRNLEPGTWRREGLPHTASTVRRAVESRMATKDEAERDARPPGNARASRDAEAPSDAGLGPSIEDATTLVPTDYDDRRDVDVLATFSGTPLRLLRNQRDGRFSDVAEAVGLGDRTAIAAAPGDFDKDGFPDFYLCEAGGDRLALSDERGRFRVSAAAPTTSRRALAFDADSDGRLDVLVADTRQPRLRLWRGDGLDAGQAASLPQEGAPIALGAADIDGDGDTDVVVVLSDGRVMLWDNRSQPFGRSVGLGLRGRVSNKSGLGAKVELRAGTLWTRVEKIATSPAVTPADVVLGLGGRRGADAVRVLWPSGILQAELPAAGAAAMQRVELEELDRKPSSCPYLYAWNGQRFEFATDFLGGGEMGYWHGPGQWNQPDPVEDVRLDDRQLVARDGLLELRVTNELEEALFLDHVRLGVIDHPAEFEIHPDEGMRAQVQPFRLYALADTRPLPAAFDHLGRDVGDRLAHLDRRFVDELPVLPVRGYAPAHDLVLELGGVAAEGSALVLSGWTDYAFSSDNVAAHQRSWSQSLPKVEVEGATPDTWHPVGELGLPVGRPQAQVFDFSGRGLGRLRRVRIRTELQIYWDQIRLGRVVTSPGLRGPTWLAPVAPRLRERGFSAEVIQTLPIRPLAAGAGSARVAISFDYGRVSRSESWKLFPGRYTREGDVGELLAASDDLFVISKPGDEIELRFEAQHLPSLPAGWRRTYLLRADGYSKEMDINSATPDELGPLPFHAMPGYPYDPGQVDPWTAEQREVYERTATRVVGRPLPVLEVRATSPAPAATD